MTHRHLVSFVLALAATPGLSSSAAWASDAGTLDRSFGHDGRQLTDFSHGSDYASGMALQGRKIVVVGDAATRGSVGRERLAVVRYGPRGRVDREFGHQGWALVRRCDPGPGSNFSAGSDVVVQPNGKIVVSGVCERDFLVARFHRNGELDRNFGENGKVVTRMASWSAAYGVALQPDGKIVAAGRAHVHYAWVGIARYRRDGSLDPTFDEDGRMFTRFGLDDEFHVRAEDVTVQPDGRLVVGGFAGSRWMVARFLSDGSPDPDFADGGVELEGPITHGSAVEIAIQPDGKMLVAGTDDAPPLDETDPDYTAFGVVRYDADGSPDESFGNAGVARATFVSGWPYNLCSGLALAANGSIVLAGVAQRWYGGHRARFALARFKPNGELDTSFGRQGTKTSDLRPRSRRRTSDFATDVVIQSQGRIVVGGDSEGGPPRYRDFALAGYRAG